MSIQYFLQIQDDEDVQTCLDILEGRRADQLNYFAEIVIQLSYRKNEDLDYAFLYEEGCFSQPTLAPFLFQFVSYDSQ